MDSTDEKFFKIVSEEPNGETTISVKARVVRMIMGGKIKAVSDDCVTIIAKDGDVFRIGKYIYIWRAELKELEIQC